MTNECVQIFLDTLLLLCYIIVIICPKRFGNNADAISTFLYNGNMQLLLEPRRTRMHYHDMMKSIFPREKLVHSRSLHYL